MGEDRWARDHGQVAVLAIALLRLTVALFLLLLLQCMERAGEGFLMVAAAAAVLAGTAEWAAGGSGLWCEMVFRHL